MSAAQQFILSYGSNKEKAHHIAEETARSLENQETTLIEVVQSLGDYINDEDHTNRSRALEYLVQVTAALNLDFLSKQQVQVLCQFFCDRVEDDGAPGGLRYLQSKSRYNNEMAVMTFRALVEHYGDLQLRPQPQRLLILELLNDLMSKRRDALRKLGDEAIIGITDLVANEKDPRNLMVVFSVLRVVIVEWDISAHAETLFDSVFCYFPITFRPPPGDPYGITAQDLKDRLRGCIASSGHFAPHAFPQLLDKLDSTSANVKRDVLLTIASCSLSYGLTTVSNYAVTLWDSLKYEIFNAQEEDIEKDALLALESIAIRLSRDLETTESKSPLAIYLKPITKECNEKLQEPQHKLAKAAGSILSILGGVSQASFNIVIRSCFPPLSTVYQAAETIPKQRSLLEVFVHLLDAAIVVYGTPAVPAPKVTFENPLLPFKDRLFELTSQALMSSSIEEVSFRIVALKALLRLCLLRQYLEDNEIGLVVQYLDDIVLSENPNGRDDLKKEAISGLVEVSRIKPQLIMNITFPAFMARLPDRAPAAPADYLITLEGLAQLSVDKFVADTLVRRLLNRLDIVLSLDSSPAYPQAIVSTLQFVLARRDLQNDANMQEYVEKIVVGLTVKAVKACTGATSTLALTEPETLERLGRLNSLIIRALDHHKQLSIANQCYSLFMEESDFQTVPFQDRSSPLSQRMTLILSSAILGAIHSTAIPQFLEDGQASRQRLVDELVRLISREDNLSIKQALLRQVSLVINKFTIQKDLEYAIRTLSDLIQGLDTDGHPSDSRIRTIFWVSKALLLRLYKPDLVLEELLSLLSNDVHGAAIARGFSLLLAPDEILLKENGANIRLLAKQKIFSLCIPRIANDFKASDPRKKPNYLIALSGIIKFVTTEVVMQEIDLLLPLLLQSLDLEDPTVKAATIHSLTTVAEESAAALESHAGSIISRLLGSSARPNVNSDLVRLNALKCLASLPGRIKDSTLLPYRNKVTRGLMPSLDDPRRDVRRQAVDCRTAWLNMDEPDSDE